MTAIPSPPQDEGVEEPLDELEMLAQRYVDGTLDDPEAQHVRQLLEIDTAFAGLVEGYSSLFSALDRHAFEAPLDLASQAVVTWTAQTRTAEAGWLQVFGGIRRGVGVFAVLDLVLASMLVGLVMTRGPVALFKSWVLSVKDLIVFASHLVPSPEVAAAVLPALMLLCVALLGGVVFGLRTYMVRAEVPR